MGLHIYFSISPKNLLLFHVLLYKKKEKNRPSVGTDTNRGQVKKKVKKNTLK
jgi:hypothetical protein